MNLNQLLFHRQIARIREDLRKPPVHCGSRFDLVAHYERWIDRARRDMSPPHHPS